MYQYKYEEQDTLFIEKSYNIKMLKQEDVMKNLEIKQKFIFAESLRFTNSYRGSHLDTSNHHGRKSSDSSGPFDSSTIDHGESIPYAEAIKAIEKIQEHTNP